MPQPPAYLLTWTTYGTWLPGDERGCVDAAHNAPGSEFAPPNARRQAVSADALVQPPYRLDDAARHIVYSAIVEQCEYRGWELVALNVRANHVHVVVRCADVAAQGAARKLKARATRRLREERLIAPDRHVWTERSSGRHLWDEDSVQAAVRYVQDGQGADLI